MTSHKRKQPEDDFVTSTLGAMIGALWGGVLLLILGIPMVISKSLDGLARLRKSTQANKPGLSKTNAVLPRWDDNDRFEIAEQIAAVRFEGFIAYLWVYSKSNRIVRQLKCVRADLVQQLQQDRFPMECLAYQGGGQNEIAGAMLATESDAARLIHSLLDTSPLEPSSVACPVSSDRPAAPALPAQRAGEVSTPATPALPAQRAGKVTTPATPARAARKPSDVTGTVLDFGETYRFSKEDDEESKRPTFFLTIQPGGQASPVTRYGVVLADQVAKQNVQRGDRIKLSFLGKEKVQASDGKRSFFRNQYALERLS